MNMHSSGTRQMELIERSILGKTVIKDELSCFQAVGDPSHYCMVQEEVSTKLQPSTTVQLS